MASPSRRGVVKVAVTGAEGFLGRHLRVRLRAQGSHEVVAIGRAAFAEDAAINKALGNADVVVHLAGVNRGDPHEVEAGNQHVAQRLIDVLDSVDHAPPIVFANSIQAGQDTPYGRGKQRAADILAVWADKRGTSLVDIVYPNLFGESGRPDYNSFVSTFCERLANGDHPQIHADRAVDLLHAQDAAQVVIDQFVRLNASSSVEAHGLDVLVSEVADRLADVAAIYATGTLPDLADTFTLQLFNTYRSYLFPRFYPRALTVNSDARGGFVEAVQSAGGSSQASFSTTRPGVIRGNHFHLRKVERFLVLKGTARIAVRPVYGSHVEVFEVTGESPAFVDMPTLCTHNITNIGDDDLYTLFWANEIYDPADADTFMEPVG